MFKDGLSSEEIKKFLTVATAVVLSIFLFVIPVDAAEPVEEWSKTYNGGRAYAAQQTSDGGYIITGW